MNQTITLDHPKFPMPQKRSSATKTAPRTLDQLSELIRDIDRKDHPYYVVSKLSCKYRQNKCYHKPLPLVQLLVHTVTNKFCHRLSYARSALHQYNSIEDAVLHTLRSMSHCLNSNAIKTIQPEQNRRYRKLMRILRSA